MAEGYKDWSAGDILTAADLEDYTVKQSVMRFADSSARTSALSGVLAEGMVVYLKDTNKVEYYDGSSWIEVGAGVGTYVDYSASVTFANFTLGNGSVSYANYVRIGNFVHYHGRINWGSTTAITATPFAIESLPVSPAVEQKAAGQFWAEESGVGARFGLCRITPTQLLPYAYQETGSYIRADNVDATTPFTWGTNDNFSWSVIYQAAS